MRGELAQQPREQRAGAGRHTRHALQVDDRDLGDLRIREDLPGRGLHRGEGHVALQLVDAGARAGLREHAPARPGERWRFERTPPRS